MDENLKKLLGLPNVERVETIDQTEVREGDIIMLGIPREAVERGHIEVFLREFEKYGKRGYRGQVMMSFAGYDYDPREVYQIPEIRTWMNRLLTNVPHLFYFMTFENHNVLSMFLCLAPIIARGGGRVDIEKAGARRLIEKISRSAVSFARKKKDSDAIQFALANRLLTELGYDHS